MGNCKALVCTCIDFRFQEATHSWLKAKNLLDSHDRLASAGSVKDLDFLLFQLELSKNLHGITEVYLLGHEECGAFNKDDDVAKESLKKATRLIREKFSDLKVQSYFVTLEKEYQLL